MAFSVADFPLVPPHSLGDIVEQLGKNEPERNGLSSDQIAALVPKIDDSIALTHGALDHILQYDLNWRTSVFQGKTEYDEAIEKRLESGLRAWVDSTEQLLSELDKVRAYGAYSESMETLRPRVAEVRRMLTPDDEFFEGEELDNLSAEAIAADEKGLTVEFQAMDE